MNTTPGYLGNLGGGYNQSSLMYEFKGNNSDGNHFGSNFGFGILRSRYMNEKNPDHLFHSENGFTEDLVDYIVKTEENSYKEFKKHKSEIKRILSSLNLNLMELEQENEK